MKCHFILSPSTPTLQFDALRLRLKVLSKKGNERELKTPKHRLPLLDSRAPVGARIDQEARGMCFMLVKTCYKCQDGTHLVNASEIRSN